MKNKKATINPVSDDNKCFQYSAIVALNHEKIGKNSQKISTIKAFVNKYNWKGINCPSRKDDWKQFEKNNPKMALNVLYPEKNEYISCHYLKKRLKS